MIEISKQLTRAARGAVKVHAARAASSVVRRARDAGLLDVGYGYTDTPFGRMLVAVTPKGLVRVAMRTESPDEVLQELSDRLSPRVLEAPIAVDAVRRELDEYFEGKRQVFDLPLDWALSSGFREKVLRATARIPYGGVSSYREMATRAGNARASRAAGSALATNPIPIVVPCHRVLRTGGHLGGYGGGLPMKEALLKMEGVRLA
ncbi:MAG: methylated-DNA--[protein]-cysteine S-methyltransferase [Actinomycetota bacterium]